MNHLVSRSYGPLFILLAVAASFILASSSPPSSKPQNQSTNGTHMDFYAISWPLKTKFAEFLTNVAANSQLSLGDECRQQVVRFADDLNANKADAMRMFDSFAKFKPGLLSNQFTDFGHYEQCLTQTNPPARYVLLEVDIEASERKFSNQINERHFLFQKPLVAICVPGVCTESNVTAVLESDNVVPIIHPFKLKVITSELIGSNEIKEHKLLRYSSRTILAIIIGCSVISTICIRFLTHLKLRHPLMDCFDVYKNTQAIFQPIKEEHQRTAFFNVFRSNYLLFAIYGHLLVPMSPSLRPYYHSIIESFLSSETQVSYMQTFSFIIAANFIMSSALNVISWMPAFEARKGNISFFSFLIIRMLRTYPVVITYLLLVASFPWITSCGGPLMNYMQNTTVNLLLTNGWRELTFTSNFQGPNDLVIPVGWFISSDMQMYALSFIVIYLFYKKPRLGLLSAFLMLLIGMVLHWIHLSVSGISPTSFVIHRRFHLAEEMFEVNHLNSVNYLSSYAVGLIFGYLVARKVELAAKWHNLLYWSSLSLFLATLTLPALIYDPDGYTNYSRTVEMLFGVGYKPLICIGMCGLLYSSWLNPKSTWVSNNRFVTVLARLSFSMFLVHPIQIMFHFASESEATKYTQAKIQIQSLYIIVTCLFYGYLMHVLVEAPFYRLTRLLSESKSPSKLLKLNSSCQATSKVSAKQE